MSKSVDDVKCPSCRAPIKFNAKSQKFICDYCRSSFTIDSMKKKQREENKVDDTNYVEYKCPDCGAKIIADDQTAATFCLYCGNTAILKNKLSGKFAPSKVMPFKKDKNDAIEAFISLRKGRPFMPSTFNSEKNIEKITGLYVPFWLFEIMNKGDITAKCKKIKNWVVGDTHYTKTSIYDVEKGGNFNYLRVPIDGSTRFNNDIMSTLEPFDYNELVDYDHAYLSGYLAERYDIEPEDVYDEVKERTIKSTEKYLESEISHYSSTQIIKKEIIDNRINTEYVLLPVWMVNVKYKNKYYLFAMNGQSGEFVGNIPIDKGKVVLWSVIIFVITFLLTVLIYYLIFLGGN